MHRFEEVNRQTRQMRQQVRQQDTNSLYWGCTPLGGYCPVTYIFRKPSSS